MTKRELFVKAHEMTREIVKENGVNYKAQFGICLSFLYKGESEMIEVKEMNVQKVKGETIYTVELTNGESYKYEVRNVAQAGMCIYPKFGDYFMVKEEKVNRELVKCSWRAFEDGHIKIVREFSEGEFVSYKAVKEKIK